MINVTWQGGMRFEGVGPSGGRIVMDTFPDEGEEAVGPTPLETFLMSAAACSAMDVVSILEKKRMTVESYCIEVETVRDKERPYPRPFQKITLKHVLSGPNLTPEAVARAVELSDEKYCSVMATLRATPELASEWKIDTPAETQ